MKKILAFVFAASMALTFVSCGPSAKEKKADSLQQDSTKKSMNNDADHMIDSMNAAMAASEKADKEKAAADSAHKADSVSKLKKK